MSALDFRSEHYPRVWNDRVPSQVRMLTTVGADFPCGLIRRLEGKQMLVAYAGQVYRCTVNSHGAVSVILRGREELGVKPDEFEVVGFHPAPDPELLELLENDSLGG